MPQDLITFVVCLSPFILFAIFSAIWGTKRKLKAAHELMRGLHENRLDDLATPKMRQKLFSQFSIVAALPILLIFAVVLFKAEIISVIGFYISLAIFLILGMVVGYLINKNFTDRLK